MIFRTLSLTLLTSLLPMVAEAQWWESSFDLDVGYRKDTITCLIDAFDPPDNFILSNDLTLDNLTIVEGGAKGKVIVNEVMLFKSYLYSGGILDGNYREVTTLANGAKDTTKLSVKSGQTLDFALGGGFLIPICYCVRVGPTGGWSYNHQHVKMSGCQQPLKGLQYKNRLQGAWIGADSYISFCGFSVNAGYEYHIPHWSAYWLLKGHNVQGGPYSDVRKSTRGWGNVVYFDAATTSFCCIRLNCQLKYQYWKMRDGCEHPKSKSFAAVGLGANEVDKVQRATWQSFEALLGIGLDF